VTFATPANASSSAGLTGEDLPTLSYKSSILHAARQQAMPTIRRCRNRCSGSGLCI
jgi:hypothetical protein